MYSTVSGNRLMKDSDGRSKNEPNIILKQPIVETVNGNIQICLYTITKSKIYNYYINISDYCVFMKHFDISQTQC